VVWWSCLPIRLPDYRTTRLTPRVTFLRLLRLYLQQPHQTLPVTTPKQTAFLAAYDACHDAFLRYATTVAFGKCDVRDLVQDVLLTAFQNFERIEEGKLLRYLLRAARNRSISLGRKRRCKVEDLEEQSLERLRAKGATADDLLNVEALYRALHRLPEKQRNALILFEINGFSIREVASLQACSEASVKMKLSRGRKRLRELLTDTPRSYGQVLLSAKSILL
ncbi:MAG: sigma-70 family RNA polymerase sigma factor, partial [Bacteroidota bacterium]